MSHVPHILAAIVQGDPKSAGAAPAAACLPEPIEGAEADRAAALVETTPALSRNRPGAHVRE
jgi:hypothetical protein